MAWSAVHTKTMALKYHFPLVRLPARRARGWMYYTSEDLINRWFAGLMLNTRRYLAERKPRGTSKLRESDLSPDASWQVSDIPAQSSSQQVSSIQSPLDTNETLDSNANNINELARTSQGGGV